MVADAIPNHQDNLDAKYIIHTIGPSWVDGNHDEREILHSCYRKFLNLAAELECKSIAFPLIATGVYSFPKDEALQIALAEINKFLLSHDMKVILVVFDRKAFELSGKLVGDIEEYIDEHSADEIRNAEYGGRYSNARRERLERLESLHSAIMPDTFDEDESEEDESESQIIFAEAAAPSFPDVSGMSLDEVLDSSEDTFQQRLFKLIDESGMDDVTVYKKANIDRKVFSRIRCKEDYKPKKKTAVAFAIALARQTTTPFSFFDILASSRERDCDTLTCIAGAIAEAFYGVPEGMKEECRKRLPNDMLNVLDRFMQKIADKNPPFHDSFLDGS